MQMVILLCRQYSGVWKRKLYKKWREKIMEIQQMNLGAVMTNCYLVCNEQTKEAVVIDPADDGEYIAKRLQKTGYTCKAILLTHGHFDHIGGVDALRDATGASVYIYEQEAKMLEDPRLNCSGMLGNRLSVKADQLFHDEEILELAGMKFKVLLTPGHTSGSVCFYMEEEGILFSGDTLFQESVGRSDLPTGNGRRLVKSILERLMPLGDQIAVYPGHGEETTIGHERVYNYYLK